MPNAIIAGTGSYAPEHVVPNQYFDRVGSNDAWIQERLGIKERRISQGETTSELATKAAQRALDMELSGLAAGVHLLHLKQGQHTEVIQITKSR